MRGRTTVRDCLYLNWAFPAASLPPPPEPLVYQVHGAGDEAVIFGSAQLFWHDRLQIASLPSVPLAYPQFHLRLHIVDEEGLPAVLLQSIMVPTWVVPGARWLARQPVISGRFDFPRPSRAADAEAWHWSVERGEKLRVSVRHAAPVVSGGPSLGSWQQTVSYFQHRRRGYVESATGLSRIEISEPQAALWPVAAQVEERGLLRVVLPLATSWGWPALHSAWLYPEIPLTFELEASVIPASVRRPVATDPATFSTSR